MSDQQSFDYQAEALRTLSNKWHGDSVDSNDFAETVLAFIRAAERLDCYKKALFYGETGKLPPTDRRPGDQHYRPLYIEEGRQLLHAILGAATESGELCEAVFDLMGGTLDDINICEEFGDLEWYVAIGADALGSTVDKFHHANTAKLRQRYPDKFSEYDATRRDTLAEREVLKKILDGLWCRN